MTSYGDRGDRCASAGLHLSRGYVDPALAMPVMLGVLVGAFTGSRMLVATTPAVLRMLLGVVIVAWAIEMIVHGWHSCSACCLPAC